jgi:hypothetical protein
MSSSRRKDHHGWATVISIRICGSAFANCRDDGSYSRFNSARKLVEWSTKAYDTQSARELSAGNGLSSFILTGSKQLGSKFLERATTPNVTPAA